MFKVMKNDHFLNIFISFGFFPRILGRLVACPFVFILFDDRDWHEGCSNL